MIKMAEEWRPVAGYEGWYEVSSAGRVRSVSRIVAGRAGKPKPVNGRLLKLVPDPWGYLIVGLSRDNKARVRKVHQLVGETFLGGPTDEKPFCLHWNDDQNDNRVENLRYGDRADNTRDGIRNGRYSDWRVGHPRFPHLVAGVADA